MGDNEGPPTLDMVAVTRHLEQHTPKSSLEIPLTETIVFTLLPRLAPPPAETLRLIDKDFIQPSSGGVGLRLAAWSFSR